VVAVSLHFETFIVEINLAEVFSIKETNTIRLELHFICKIFKKEPS
jgi:hypothetical protein